MQIEPESSKFARLKSKWTGTWNWKGADETYYYHVHIHMHFEPIISVFSVKMKIKAKNLHWPYGAKVLPCNLKVRYVCFKDGTKRSCSFVRVRNFRKWNKDAVLSKNSKKKTEKWCYTWVLSTLFVLKYYEFFHFKMSYLSVYLICLLNVQARCLKAPDIYFTMQCTANVSPKRVTGIFPQCYRQLWHSKLKFEWLPIFSTFSKKEKL